MLSKLRAFASLYRELGPRWMIFRLAYAFRLRTGLLRAQMPVGEWSDYRYLLAERSDERSFRHVVEARQLPENIPWNPQTATTEADRILNGELKYFSHQWVKTDFPPNWHKDPISSTELNSTKHWSHLSDDAATDIKFIWEPNRFTFVYTLVRAYAASHDEKYPKAFWALIEDWAEHNPPNTGPNWMDGQEVALRLIAWTFGYFAFLKSPSSTPERKENFIVYVAAQAERIYKNTTLAISAHNNHSITEAFGLWMTGLLFPDLKHAGKYLSFGRASLEREVREQIFPDGTYSMYSLNYHRFVLHIYLYAIKLGETNNASFSTQLIDLITKSIEYLSHLINPETGGMPVYGSNDGALVLPLNNCDFTDYRPLLQLGWSITKGEYLFEPGPWDEDIFWLCGESLTAKNAKYAKGKINLGALSGLRGKSFPNGGNYILHGTNSHALIRCTDFISRPSHADQLHVDLWIRGHNIAIDAGTYLYSGQDPWRNGLAHTSVHNTVTVDGKDQMTILSRFTWTNWSKGKVLKHDKDTWQGQHDGYEPVSHKRTVMSLEGDRWLVIDNLSANEPHHYALHWLLNDYLFEHSGNSILLSLEDMKYKLQIGMLDGKGELSVARADPASIRGWWSRYYGHKEPAISVMLEADLPQVTFWSFFGFEDDSVSLSGNTLQVNDTEIDIKTMDG